MKTEQEFIAAAKNKLSQWQTVLDELEVQAALGKAELRETYERERKNFNKFMNDQKTRFRRDINIADAHREKLQEKIEMLDAVLDLDLEKTKTAFAKNKKEILQRIYELEGAILDVNPEAGEALQRELDRFKTKLDTYRIMLALRKFDETDERDTERTRAELRDEIKVMRNQLTDARITEDRLDNFMDEVSEGFTHLKKAFTEVFNK